MYIMCVTHCWATKFHDIAESIFVFNHMDKMKKTPYYLQPRCALSTIWMLWHIHVSAVWTLLSAFTCNSENHKSWFGYISLKGSGPLISNVCWQIVGNARRLSYVLNYGISDSNVLSKPRARLSTVYPSTLCLQTLTNMFPSHDNKHIHLIDECLTVLTSKRFTHN